MQHVLPLIACGIKQLPYKEMPRRAATLIISVRIRITYHQYFRRSHNFLLFPTTESDQAFSKFSCVQVKCFHKNTNHNYARWLQTAYFVALR